MIHISRLDKLIVRLCLIVLSARARALNRKRRFNRAVSDMLNVWGMCWRVNICARMRSAHSGDCAALVERTSCRSASVRAKVCVSRSAAAAMETTTTTKMTTTMTTTIQSMARSIHTDLTVGRLSAFFVRVCALSIDPVFIEPSDNSATRPLSHNQFTIRAERITLGAVSNPVEATNK